MTKELLQHTWWALERASRGPPGGAQGYTAPQFGKHCLRRNLSDVLKPNNCI